MADTFTATLNLCKPEIDASAETWGQKLNADLDLLDQFAATMNAFVAANDSHINGIINSVFPRGVIVAWSGGADAVPVGWLLCDGANGTPDLADRFILGAPLSRPNWGAGGGFSYNAVTDAQGTHAHGGSTQGFALTTWEMPTHRHGGNTDAQGNHDHAYSAIVGGGGGQIGTGGTPAQGATPRTSIDGNHAHNIVTDYQGNGQPHYHGVWPDGSHQHNVNVSVVPPYFSLAYIMKA